MKHSRLKPLGLFTGLCLSIVFFSLVLTPLQPFSAGARCPDGFHKSPSGDCEKVTHSGGLPRCPDGFHRSPDGDCERVSSGKGGNSGSDSDNENDDNDNSRTTEERNEDNDETDNSDETELFNSQTPLPQSTECESSADCFRGTVTEIVDGDTLDVNNVRIRLSMVNTPERGDPGYDEATAATVGGKQNLNAPLEVKH